MHREVVNGNTKFRSYGSMILVPSFHLSYLPYHYENSSEHQLFQCLYPLELHLPQFSSKCHAKLLKRVSLHSLSQVSTIISKSSTVTLKSLNITLESLNELPLVLNSNAKNFSTWIFA